MPAKSAEQEWKRFIKRITEIGQDVEKRQSMRAVRAKHALEKRLAELERLPKNKDRNSLIKSLREQLE